MAKHKVPLVITSKGKLIDSDDTRMIWVDNIRQAILKMEDKALRAFLEQSNEE